MTPEVLGGKVDCIWDRGSLVAIDVAKRPEYAKVMMSLMNDKFAYLIASLEREVEPVNPMPHSASFDDIECRSTVWKSSFKPTVLDDRSCFVPPSPGIDCELMKITGVPIATHGSAQSKL